MSRRRRHAPRSLPRSGGRRSSREQSASWSPAAASIEDEAVFAVIGVGRRRIADPVETVESAEQNGFGIARIGEAVVGPRQILLRHRAHHIWRHQHHQLGLLIYVIAALE